MIFSREKKLTTNVVEIVVALKIKEIEKIKKIKSKTKFKLKFKSQIILNMKFVSSKSQKSKKKFVFEKNSVRTHQKALNAKNDAIENVENNETRETENIVDSNEKEKKKEKKKKKKKKEKNEISKNEISKLLTTMNKLQRQLDKKFDKKFDKSKQKIIFIDFEKKEFSIQFVFRQIKKRIKSKVLNSENELRKKMKKKKN